MGTQVSGGHYTLGEARMYVLQMAFIILCMLVPIQMLAALLHRQRKRLGRGILIFLESVAVLVLYLVLVWWWRNQWNPSQGLSDYAAFGPVVGHVNAVFFSEYNGFSFLFFVVPFVAAIAGFLVRFDLHEPESPNE